MQYCYKQKLLIPLFCVLQAPFINTGATQPKILLIGKYVRMLWTLHIYQPHNKTQSILIINN